MEYVGPGARYSSRLSLGPDNTGLVGTVRFRLLDNDGSVDDPVYGPSAAGIIEDPAGSGDYVFPDTVGVAPTTAGHYARAWDLGVGTRLLYDDDLLVTRTAVNPFTPSGNEYVTREELLIWLELEGENNDGFYVDADRAVEAASRACDAYKKKVWYTTDRTRYYTARLGAQQIEIHDLASLTSLELDFDNDGTYETTWTEGDEFYLDPDGAADDGFPYSSIVLTRAGRRFPRYDRAVKLTGSFGWPTVPANVRQAALILAARLFKRREIPFAILPVAAAEMVTAARLGRIDPDVAWLLDNIPGIARDGLSVVQLR